MMRSNEMFRGFAVVGFLLMALSVSTPAAAGSEGTTDVRWGPYFKDDKGREWDFPADVSSIKDRDWMFLAFEGYSGAKPSIAVLVAGNQPPSATFWEWSDGFRSYRIPIDSYNASLGAPVEGIEDMLTTALFNTHRFRLAERGAMAEVRNEQSLGNQGTSTPQTAPPAGRILGAQYLVKAKVIEWKDGASRSHGVAGGLTSAIPGIGGIGWDRSSAELAMNFEVIDATTAEVVDSRTVRATAKSWGITPGGLFWGTNSIVGGLAHFEKNSPASYAVMACINKAIYQISMALRERPWTGSVMKVTGTDVYINGGAQAGLKVGMEVAAVSKGEDMTDPDTGNLIPTQGEALGSLTIAKVEEKYAVLHASAGCRPLKRGDLVRVNH